MRSGPILPDWRLALFVVLFGAAVAVLVAPVVALLLLLLAGLGAGAALLVLALPLAVALLLLLARLAAEAALLALAVLVVAALLLLLLLLGIAILVVLFVGHVVSPSLHKSLGKRTAVAAMSFRPEHRQEAIFTASTVK